MAIAFAKLRRSKTAGEEGKSQKGMRAGRNEEMDPMNTEQGVVFEPMNIEQGTRILEYPI